MVGIIGFVLSTVQARCIEGVNAARMLDELQRIASEQLAAEHPSR